MSSEATVGEVCIANIGPKQRQMRLTFGVIGVVAGLAVLAGLIASGLPVWARLAAFPIFLMGAIGFWQWRDKT
jgi:hypothetical protein